MSKGYFFDNLTRNFRITFVLKYDFEYKNIRSYSTK